MNQNKYSKTSTPRQKSLASTKERPWYATHDTIDLYALVFDEIEFNLKDYNIETEYVMDVANRVCKMALQYKNLLIALDSHEHKIYKASNEPIKYPQLSQLTNNKLSAGYMLTKENFTRINNDVNGNPRYVTHFNNLLTDYEKYQANLTIDKKYDLAVNKAKAIGGKRFNNKLFGGGIVFGSVFNLDDLISKIENLEITIRKPNFRR